MKKLNVGQTIEMMSYVADKMIESKKLLCEIDGKIGDGDHGLGIERGFMAVKDFLSEKTPETIYDIFSGAGMAMMNSMGGASGVIFSAMFMGVIQQPKEEVLSPKAFVGMCENGLKRIKLAGKAQKGDKTMLDALEPAVDAMKQVSEDCGFEELFDVAYQAALQGVEDTKKYTAKFGRAKFLGDRSLGCEDAGATSVSIIFGSMSEYVSRCK
ncbi:MAG: dihydroxyacetone kinase subunit DhaL [Anaerostipes sp.]|jgi:dihydroxyacetone kinase-like protein